MRRAANKEGAFSVLPKALGFDACMHMDAEMGAAIHGRGKAGFQPMWLLPSRCVDAGWALRVWGGVEPALAVPPAGGRALSGGCSAVPRGLGACLPQGTCAQPGRHAPLPGNCPRHACYHRRMENIPCSAAGGVSACFSWMCSTRGGSSVPYPSSDVPRVEGGMSQGAAFSPRTGRQCRCC